MFVKPRTSTRRLASLRQYAIYMEVPNFLPEFKLPTPSKAEAHPLPGLMEDIYAMLDSASDREDKCMIALLGLEGMRMHEALAIRPKDIDLNENIITVWGKGSKERRIPLTKRAAEFIVPQIIHRMISDGPGAALLSSSDSWARKTITSVASRAGITRHVSSHDLRATFATLAWAHSKDSVAVQEWLGHASFNTTLIYIGVAMKTLRAAGEF